MHLKWDGVTPEQYEQVRSIVNWEGNKPKGGNFHVAFFDNNGLRVVDVWDNAEDFNNFANNRLMPGVAQAGVTSQPDVEVYPVHAIFTPGYVPKSELETA